MTIRQIKSGKAAEPDNIPSEALKPDINIVDKQGVSDADVKTRFGKTRTAFLQVKNIWNSKQLSADIKVRIFSTNVNTVLQYGAETWAATITIIKKAQVFSNNCLHKILNICWPDSISSSLLW
ncbi:unnamed protein product [Schistosoma margrebowiei]|uniref:Uncharacterized protein n=1 Tax=Schistosoma margrebowiei TaxID=48269 RepID=A0A183MS82_9TREM|nr:unnamed protein product [Schistosoma margrebowiei]